LQEPEVIECDVAIAGGGPAGCAAALTLLRYSKLRPLVIERSAYEGWRVGETLSPGVLSLLDYLGATEAFDAQGQRRAYSTSAAWGGPHVVSRDLLFSGAGDAWHLDRAKFDRSLATLVGSALITGTTIKRASGKWQLTLSDGRELRARFVIDATGRHAAFARAQGARADVRDHLTGLVGVFAGGDEEDDGSTLVESIPDGWWYSAQLPEGRVVAALMTDADVVRTERLHERDAWLERLGRTGATRRRVAGAELVREPIPCPAHTQILDPIAGDGWVAAGDAAVGFDPLSSMGIGYALTSGIHAARAAAAALAGDPSHASLYAKDVAHHFEAYLERKRAYYRLEQRWPDEPFWARRM
jgi:flavin-dependent dehydrogenase